MIRQIGIFYSCYLFFDCSKIVLTLGHGQEGNFIKKYSFFLSLRVFGLLSSSLLFIVIMAITIKIKIIVRKPLMIKNHQHRLRNLDS